LRASADVLGVRRVVHLGYADSGHGPILYPDPQDRTRFVRAPIDEAVYRLAGVLREENASVLLSYDENGGYGHRDHIRVHEVGRRAASSTKVRLLEATAPRELVGRLYQRNAVYSPRSAITHTFDVRRFAGQKQAALAAHQSVVSGDGRSAHVFRALVKIPAPLFGILLGREWFVAPR
jgi:LmbE family N-acetylglucosaminyl deacetylase